MTTNENRLRDEARKEVDKLEKKYADRLQVNKALSRSVVSFQANKVEPIFRWFKYKEGFSRALVDYCLDHVHAKRGGALLDPFAGTGAAVFTAAKRGVNGIAIELLPVGAYFMKARQFVASTRKDQIVKWATEAVEKKQWKKASSHWEFPHLRITKGAFPKETEQAISKYKTHLLGLKSGQAQLLDFVLFSVLEEISYTRKDGQYLRWDYRAPRKNLRTKFDKGHIASFDEAICKKFDQIRSDLTELPQKDLFDDSNDDDEARANGVDIEIKHGPNFALLDEIKDKSIDYVITSPPYCNRYDYTRTYALELAYLGVDEVEIRKLRQELLTCTVEHRAKEYNLADKKVVTAGMEAFYASKCMNSVIAFLNSEKEKGLLNNNGIVTMVTGYFLDTAVHLAQVHKKLRKGGSYFMVNDNVRYNGLDIPVDCLLSEMAEFVGFNCKKIWVLPIGKGNSSQQMKKHGRSELRKCVYVWQKR